MVRREEEDMRAFGVVTLLLFVASMLFAVTRTTETPTHADVQVELLLDAEVPPAVSVAHGPGCLCGDHASAETEGIDKLCEVNALKLPELVVGRYDTISEGTITREEATATEARSGHGAAGICECHTSGSFDKANTRNHEVAVLSVGVQSRRTRSTEFSKFESRSAAAVPNDTA
jgi:hypothetical protein